MNLWKKANATISNEYFYALIIKIVVIAIGLLRTAFWARYLGAELKGNIEYIKSVTAISCVIFTFGIHQAYPLYKKKFGKNAVLKPFYRTATIQFIIYSLVSISLFLPFQSRCSDMFYAVLLTPLLVYARILQYIYLIEKPNKYNTNVLLVNIIDLLYSLILFLFVSRNYLLGITSIISLELLQIVFSSLFVYKESALAGSQNIKIKINIINLISFGLFPMIALLLTTLNYRIDVLMLKQFDNITAHDIGVYSIGIALVEKVVLIPDTLKGVLVSRLAKGKGPEEVAKLTRISFTISLLLAVMALAFGKPFINLLYGFEYLGAYKVILVSIFGVLFVMFFKLIAQYNIVNNMQKRNVAMLSVSILVNIAMNFVLIPVYGILGAAVATGIGHAVSGILFLIFFHRETKIKYRDMFIINRNDVNGFIKHI